MASAGANRRLALRAPGTPYRWGFRPRTVPDMTGEGSALSRGPARPPSVATVGWVLAATVVLTAFHFADNYLSFATYPGPAWQPGWFRYVVLASWPAFTLFAVIGFARYRDGRRAGAHPYLFAYSVTGLVSLGHFLYGAPADFTTRGLASVFIDAVAGSAVLAVTFWSVLALRAESTPGPARG